MERTPSRESIRPKRHRLVKLAAFRGYWLALALAVVASVAAPVTVTGYADDEPPPPPPSDATAAPALPQIEAKTYPVTVVRRSKSGHVYLFQIPTDELPKLGKILLLKRDDTLAMALRVLKTYPDKKQFAAKSVRKYEPVRYLSPNDAFTAVEKIADVNAAVAPLTQQEQNEVHELEKPPPTAAVAPPPPPASPVSPPPQTSKSTPATELSQPAASPPEVAPPPAPPPPAAAALPETAPAPAPPPETPLEAAPEASPEPSPEEAAPEPEASPSPDMSAEAAPEAAPEPSPESSELPSAEASPQPSAAPFDSDLDTGTAPPTSESDDALSETEEKDVDELSKIAVDEVPQIERDHYWLTAGISYFQNWSPTTPIAYYVGGDLRFGLNLGTEIFFSSKGAQDSFTLEAGVGFYKNINFAAQGDGDAFSVVPLTGTLRYNIFFSPSFAIFFYGGINYNWLAAYSPGNETMTNSSGQTVPAQPIVQAAEKLESIVPAFGTGLLFRVGPNWYTRVDLGWDALGLSLVLRF